MLKITYSITTLYSPRIYNLIIDASPHVVVECPLDVEESRLVDVARLRLRVDTSAPHAVGVRGGVAGEEVVGMALDVVAELGQLR